MKQYEIRLSINDLYNLPIIGEGTDGTVYKFNRDILLKVYHHCLKMINDFRYALNLPDKIYDKSSFQHKYSKDQISFRKFDGNDYVRLYSKDIIREIIGKQSYITRTDLPLGVVYIDNHFAGCFFKKAPGIAIHKLCGLPNSIKKLIAQSLLLDIEELLKFNIYPIDLTNSPYSYTQRIDPLGNLKMLQGHSHVLVQLFSQKTNLIDLDGKSTIYTNYFDEQLYQSALNGLCILLLEFLYDFTYINEYSEDLDSFSFELQRLNLDQFFITNLLEGKINGVADISRALKL